MLYALPGHQIALSINYDVSRFDKGDVARLAGHLRTVLEGMAANVGQNLHQLPILTHEERHQLITEWNDTDDKASESCIHSRFEEQVNRNPDAVALVYKNQLLTYTQLNQRANRLAHALLKHGVRSDIRVGVFVERSPDM